MQIQVISPEVVLFEGEVNSVSVPGKNGSFEMLNNHAPIVSSLQAGQILLRTSGSDYTFNQENEQIQVNSNELTIQTNRGVMELNNNKLIILVS